MFILYKAILLVFGELQTILEYAISKNQKTKKNIKLL